MVIGGPARVVGGLSHFAWSGVGVKCFLRGRWAGGWPGFNTCGLIEHETYPQKSAIAVLFILQCADTALMLDTRSAIGADKPGERAMIKFPSSIKNNPELRGKYAKPKQTFGEHSRYAVWPCHTRFDAVQWFVADAYNTDDRGLPAIIRQTDTLESAIAGLI